ncbi:D-alanyl-D-alanine carboxypeptidase [Oxobacter pfennigii]|uniref:D-alanyl-D-alanine carboxypeptidase n=1 Tax=Oxobacter pfennigii TaxID=36849 RepID=A0A0P8Z1X2_9CLOT|nr:M15 family metallopeptidase [Oxobacter pfennigii]KPU46117.1 D-alanyl-D-alanine carboxypeptidase [Oxobacter pfennigii]
MKKIVCLLAVTVLLSGCGNSAKDPSPAPTPTENPGSVVENTPKVTPKVAQHITDALIGAETLLVNGKQIVKNPDSILVLVNKERNLPSDWVPPDLVVPNVAFPFKEDAPRKYMRKEAAEALEELFELAQEDGIKLYAMSGYRSYETQQRLFNTEVKQSGEEAASKVVAVPGQSEHQTGLTMDVSSAGMNFTLEESFEDTKEGKWLKEHAKDAGFIIRYPKDKTHITGYSYEPWHIRYVGKEAAEFITAYDITFDEYYGMISNQ